MLSWFAPRTTFFIKWLKTSAAHMHCSCTAMSKALASGRITVRCSQDVLDTNVWKCFFGSFGKPLKFQRQFAKKTKKKKREPRTTKGSMPGDVNKHPFTERRSKLHKGFHHPRLLQHIDHFIDGCGSWKKKGECGRRRVSKLLNFFPTLPSSVCETHRWLCSLCSTS